MTPKILRGAAIGALFAIGGGVSVAAITSSPTSTSTPEVQLAQPAADVPTTTTTAAAPVEVAQDVARAETAATKAESAATRAEGAAAHVDQVVATTTTTVAPAPTQPSTVAAPIVEEQPVATTTTTVAPKQWVEIGRFPIPTADDDTPGRITVTLQTGVVRVTGFIPGGIVWLGGGDMEQGCSFAPAPGTVMAASQNCPLRTDWPLGEQVLSGGRSLGYRTGSFSSSRPVVVEEYR
jgi:hypothetical protein